jgi:glycosyltransferase involved in cell wall biosynthesis
MITEHNCGVVVPPRDPEAFAEALFMLAEIPERRRKMGRNARSLGKSQFDRDLLAGRFVDLLESVFEYHDALSETNL